MSCTDLKKPETYSLEDRYTKKRGRVFLTGTQALVRLPLLQAEYDRSCGLNTAGFISGYRGSPLGGYDKELWAASELLQKSNVNFLPAINEDLAATAVMGTQQVESAVDREVDGVFAIWYGKGPGVDRSGDALKHGNAYGSSPHGGVLVVAGDDHGCVSSTISHQSDVAFMAYSMPMLNPSTVAEYLEFGLYGIQLSRFSGCWVGFKAISETVESGASVTISEFPDFRKPDDYVAPKDGLHYRSELPGPQIEARMADKLDAVRAFVRVNPIDRTIFDTPGATLGIVTTGKAHLDVLEALNLLGLSRERLRDLGIGVYKIGLVWPLETHGAEAFVREKKEILVVEEKRGIIESQLKEFLFGCKEGAPLSVIGKHDEKGKSLLPSVGELNPVMLANVIAKRIQSLLPNVSFERELLVLNESRVEVSLDTDLKRTPYFCSGCPHNTSTKVPEGSKASGGIGCHFMASWMERNTESMIQMGGEGVSWLAKSRFLKNKHIFQNLGDGTYFHSGSLAIRQAIAANADITYKILFNDAVAMTGGQSVDGVLTVDRLAHQVHSEGVRRIAIVTDEPGKYTRHTIFPDGTTFHSRDDFDLLQKELRKISGVSVLIYDQVCAAEKRRRRKRGKIEDPAKRIYINQGVCEGCGDCSVQSNCLSIYPVETEYGRKRKIDQASCNKDYSCVKGFCPSFVTVEGGNLRKPDIGLPVAELVSRLKKIPSPLQPDLVNNYDIFVAGIGGTGVVTIGALISMAAHLENKGASVLDYTGLAQKGGAVFSHIRIGRSPESINQVRIADGQAQVMIACDAVVATDERCTRVLDKDNTQVVINLSEVPSGQFVLDRNTEMQIQHRIGELTRVVGDSNLSSIDANTVMERLMGNSIYANAFLLGIAWQQGLIPVSDDSLTGAIGLNGVNVEENIRAFNWGRLAAVDRAFVTGKAGLGEQSPLFENLDRFIEDRTRDLEFYQNRLYSKQYLEFVNRVRIVEGQLTQEDSLSWAVSRHLFKLMAYKDEYEVARLYTDGNFEANIKTIMSGDYKLRYHLAPPLLSRKKDAEGRPLKFTFGPWMFKVFKLLARLKFLRGTLFDPFGYFEERKQERKLIQDYQELILEILNNLTTENYAAALRCLDLPDQVRGYGPIKLKSIQQYYQFRAGALAQFHGTGKVVPIVVESG